jgi:hypothetical protein
MKALLSKSLVISGLFFSLQANASTKQCMLNINVDGWKNIETVLFIAAGGYAMTHDATKAEYTAVIDEVEGQVKPCLYGCDEKQEVLMILSVLNNQDQVIFTENKIATKLTSNKPRVLERESDYQKTKLSLLRSIPECEVLRLAD